MRQRHVTRHLLAAVLLLAGLAVPAGLAASAGDPAAYLEPTDPRAAPLTLDPTFQEPAEAVSAAVQTEVGLVLEAQAVALRNLDINSYLATFVPGVDDPGRGPATSPGAGLEVVGRPAVRVAEDLFGAVPPGSAVRFAGITPVFAAPGPDGLVDVLTRHVVAYRTPEGGPGLADVTVLERLRPTKRWTPGDRPESEAGTQTTQGPGPGPAWQVFDWTVADEQTARLTWLVWLSGRVTLEPFDGRLEAELTYTFFPGFFEGRPGSPSVMTFDLADTFEVTAVRGPGGEPPWECRGGKLEVSLPPPAPRGGAVTAGAGVWAADEPTRITIAYRGHVVPSGTPRRGNLDYLGAEAIYLRPDTGWYPRPQEGDQTGGFLRGSLSVTVPGWWAAAAPGRMTAAASAGGVGESRTFTWSLDLPAELYLVAGPYLVAERTTAQGVTIRTFFYAREAEWSQAYLEEAERILGFFGTRFGPYPYGNLTLAEVQDFYYGGLSARTLVLFEKDGQADPGADPWSRDLLAHEVSHQWWGEMVPIVDDADWFLWEGLASYCEALYSEFREGPKGLSRVMEDKAARYAQAARWHGEWSIKQANVRTADWQDDFVYDKGAWVFQSLRFLLGDQAFLGFLRDYVDRYAGRQPTTDDMAGLVARAGGGDSYLTGFIHRWVEEPGEPDLALARVATARRPGTGGGEQGGGYRLSFDLVDRGPTAFPRAEVKVVLADGTSKTYVARAGGNSLDLPQPAKAVQVDPDNEVLDLARSNNTWYLVAGVPVPAYAAARAAGVAAGLVVVAAIVATALGIRRRAAAHGG